MYNNKKKVSQELKNLYKPFMIVFGISLLIFILNLVCGYHFYPVSYSNGVMEGLEMVLTSISLVFGFIGLMGIVPVVIVLALLGVSIFRAVKDKNIKNVFNPYLLLTVVLVISSSFLQNQFLIECC